MPQSKRFSEAETSLVCGKDPAPQEPAERGRSMKLKATVSKKNNIYEVTGKAPSSTKLGITLVKNTIHT